MPTYLMLSRLTAKGVQTLNANPERLKEVNKDVEELGAKVLHQWACLGPFDFVNVVEAPDATTIARVSVRLGARGSSKLETHELIEIDDYLAGIEKTSARRVRHFQRTRPRSRRRVRRCRRPACG